MKNIIKALSNESELKDLSRDIIEVVVDEAFEEGIIKEIPIVKTIYSITRTYRSITDKIQLKKTLLVLLELKDLNVDEREEFLKELEDKYTSGSEKLMLAINHLQTYEKCVIFGKLSALRAKGKIDIDVYLRLTKVIQDAYLDDLKVVPYLKQAPTFLFINMKNVAVEEISPLVSLGLVFLLPSEPLKITKDEYTNDYYGGGVKFEYYLSPECKILIRVYNQLFD